VRDFIEESLDVGIEYYSIALAVEFEDPLYGLVAVSLGYEPKGRIVKLGFKDRGKKPTYHFLGHAIANHRYS
jgi:hypothetical protein